MDGEAFAKGFGDDAPATGEGAERWMRLAAFLRGLRKSMSSSSDESDSISSSLRVRGARPVSDRGESAPRTGDEAGMARRCDEGPAAGAARGPPSRSMSADDPSPKMLSCRADGDLAIDAPDAAPPRFRGELSSNAPADVVMSSKLSWSVGSSARALKPERVELLVIVVVAISPASSLVMLAARGNGLTSRSPLTSKSNVGRTNDVENGSLVAPPAASRASAFDDADLRGLARWPWTAGPGRTTPMPVILPASERLYRRAAVAGLVVEPAARVDIVEEVEEAVPRLSDAVPAALASARTRRERLDVSCEVASLAAG